MTTRGFLDRESSVTTSGFSIAQDMIYPVPIERALQSRQLWAEMSVNEERVRLA